MISAGGLLPAVTQVRGTVSPTRASVGPDIVTCAGATRKYSICFRTCWKNTLLNIIYIRIYYCLVNKKCTIIIDNQIDKYVKLYEKKFVLQ